MRWRRTLLEISYYVFFGGEEGSWKCLYLFIYFSFGLCIPNPQRPSIKYP